MPLAFLLPNERPRGGPRLHIRPCPSRDPEPASPLLTVVRPADDVPGEQQLYRQPGVERPPRQVVELLGPHRHVDVRRVDAEARRQQPPAPQAPRAGGHGDAARDLGHAARVGDLPRPLVQRRRHDRVVELRADEVHDAGEDPETGERPAFHVSIDSPVIASGCSMPRSSRIVGATSARIPSSRTETSSLVTMNGTGLSECAVFGDPSGSSMLSALPWSAVITSTPPESRTTSTTSARQRSTVSTASTAAGIDPVCPTMSALAKLMIPKPKSPPRHAFTNASAASGALIAGLWS